MTADEYRAKATEVRGLASTAPTPDVREKYLTIADGWEKLAREAELFAAKFNNSTDRLRG